MQVIVQPVAAPGEETSLLFRKDLSTPPHTTGIAMIVPKPPRGTVRRTPSRVVVPTSETPVRKNRKTDFGNIVPTPHHFYTPSCKFHQTFYPYSARVYSARVHGFFPTSNFDTSTTHDTVLGTRRSDLTRRIRSSFRTSFPEKFFPALRDENRATRIPRIRRVYSVDKI